MLWKRQCERDLKLQFSYSLIMTDSLEDPVSIVAEVVETPGVGSLRCFCKFFRGGYIIWVVILVKKSSGGGLEIVF
jgi:hypothetical protein